MSIKDSQIKIALITACGKKKENKPLQAGKLYRSSRIRHLYKKSKNFSVPFYILSAKYGLVFGDRVIEPYEALMDQQSCEKMEKQLEDVLRNFDAVIYYRGGAGKEYFECIKRAAQKLGVEFIYFGYKNMGGIGELGQILEEIREKHQ